jgi:hypothetical protein
MNPEHRNAMQPEYDMRGGVRGKYLDRYRRWTSITDATGAVEVCAVTSAGGATAAEIVLPQMRVIYVTGPVLKELRPVIAPEESDVAANAI